MENNDRDNKLTSRDVYDYLWRGRDFELQQLWQRSVFLASFLIAILTGYSMFIKDVFIPNLSGQIICEETGNFLIALIPIFLTLLGAIFSKLWIMMAKGSKAWCEVYEDSIAKISDFIDDDESKNNVWGNIKKYNGTKSEFPEDFLFGKIQKKYDTKWSKCIFSTDGGAYSVSRINILIGMIFNICFCLLTLCHIFCFVCMYKNICTLITLKNVIISFIVITILIEVIIYFCIPKYCKSETLEDMQ